MGPEVFVCTVVGGDASECLPQGQTYYYPAVLYVLMFLMQNLKAEERHSNVPSGQCQAFTSIVKGAYFYLHSLFKVI